MREGLRSSSSKREDSKSGLGLGDGDLRRVKIPDLNLEDDQDELLSEEKGKLCCELSKTDGKFIGLVCDKEGLIVDDDKGVEAEGRGMENGSLNLECSRNVGGKRPEAEEGGEDQVGDADGSKEVCPKREMNGEEEIDDSSGNMQEDNNVGGGKKEAVVQGLSCSVDSDDRVLKSHLAVDKDEGLEGNLGSVLSLCVEGDVKKNNLESSSKCVEVSSDLKTTRMEEHVEPDPDLSRKDVQSNLGTLIDSPVKLGVNEGIKCKFDEGDRCERLGSEGEQESVSVVARILRSRVVPANFPGEETERMKNRKRNRGTIGQGVEPVVMNDEDIKSDVCAENMSHVGKSKRYVDQNVEEFVQPNDAQVLAGAEDVNKLIKSSEKKRKRGRPKIYRDHPEEEVAEMNVDQNVEEFVQPNDAQVLAGAEDVNKLIKSSEKKRKRGRPKIYRDHPEEEVAEMNEVKANSNVEDESLNIKAVGSLKKKDGCGRPRPRKSANCFENEEVGPDEIKIESRDVSSRCVGRPKISRDHHEEAVGQPNEVKASKVEDEVLNSKSARNLKKQKKKKKKKKDGRGRPRKYPISIEKEKVVPDKTENRAGDVSNKSVGRLPISRYLPEEEVVQMHEVKAPRLGHEGLNNNSGRSFKKKGGRGRPRKYANCFGNVKASFGKPIVRSKNFRACPKKDVAQMNEVNVVKVEDEGLNIKSAKISKKKDGRGRPRKFADCSGNEKVVPSKIENVSGVLNKKSARSLTPTRRSGRHKRSVDYCEEKAVKKRRKLSFSKHDDEVLNEDEDKGVRNKGVKKLKKKGKRGRPKKMLGNGEVKMQCHDKDEVKDDGKMKVSLATAPVRRSRQDNHPQREPKRSSDGLSPLVGDRPDRKVSFAGVEKDRIEGSKGEETPLPENNLPVKRRRVEAAGSLSSEKNSIRQQIVDMLRNAGWTVQYRPRNGREYNDAVYVNREGKTHWSVTKAYNSLMQEVEEGRAGSGDPNFTFVPLPEEVLRKLFRVVSKTRSDKNKKKKRKGDGDTSDEETTGDKTGSEKSRRKAGAKRKDSALKRKSSVRAGTQGRRRCALVVRRSNQGSNPDSDGVITHPGKQSVLAWMIDLGTISLGGKVRCKNPCESESIFEGSITRDGIHCCCCKEVISVSEFEIHSGSKLCRPYENVYIESGSSLLQCLLESWNKQEERGRLGFHGVNVDDDDPNDDTCAICGDGGDLMCCDGCPSTFHQGCLNIEELPSGEWHCVFCSCKVCGVGGESATATQGVDCITISSKLVTCSLCKEKYHKSCIIEEDQCVESRREEFCGKNCEQISERLASLLGARCDLGDGFSYTLLQRSDLKADSDTPEAQKIQNNSKLAVALAVMDECFLPIIDPRSGVNMIRHVVYSCGSNFNRLNFSSFLTVVLEKGDEIISAASIRIHGKRLAEMPFVGTRNIYRRQGMCRRLLAAIEQALGTLEIEKLVIPAIPELMHTWTSVFGFKPLEKPDKEEMRSMNMLVFAHTDMLRKPVAEQQSGVKSTALIAEKDANSGVSESGHLNEGSDKTNADILEIDNGSLDGKFDLNCDAPNVPDSPSDERRMVHPDSDTENCKDEVKGRTNSGVLKDAKNDGPCMNSSEVRTLHPDLNLMAEIDSLCEEKSQRHHAPDTMKSDEVAKSTSNSSGLTNVKGCCVVESDNDQNGDSTDATSSEERGLNPDLNIEGTVLENHDSLPSDSAIICPTIGFGDRLSIVDGHPPVDGETRRDDNPLEVCQLEEIQCSYIETSKTHNEDSNNGPISAGAEEPTKSTEHSDSEELVACTRTAQLTNESLCNMSSVAGESCVAGIFHGSGIAKVGPTKS